MHLPVGVSNFRDLINSKDPKQQGYLYVDKTNFIKEIIYDLTPVIVLTRPRRFGKTLNLSMLHHFFANEVEGQPTKGLFDGLNISKDDACMSYQGKYPVVFITFKDLKQSNFAACIKKLKDLIAKTYRSYRAVFESTQIAKDDKRYIENILEQNIDPVIFESALQRLLEILHKYYNQKPILLIDEYDTPLQEAYLRGYYEELIPFFRNFLSAPLKDENNLQRAVLTGILRVSKESLFSGLSNVKIYSVLHKQYSSYFGFTEQETNELLHKAKLPANLEQTKEWYNGYNFGGTTVYNPWSIIEFIKEEGKVSPYWIHTSGNDLIRDLVIKSAPETQDKIGQLIAGQVIKEIIDEHIIFQDLEQNTAAIWSLFLMTGYLKAITVHTNAYGDEECELAIPNKEVESLYKRIARDWLSGNRGIVWYKEFLSALVGGKVEEFAKQLQNAILEIASYHDTGKNTQETFYQGLMLGILAGLKDTHEVRSNRESGDGRYDLAIIPKNSEDLGIIMEFKAINDPAKLDDVAKEALTQIKQSKYTTELHARGILNVCNIGIAFSGKIIRVMTDYMLPNNPHTRAK